MYYTYHYFFSFSSYYSLAYFFSRAVKYKPLSSGSEINGFFPLPMVKIFPILVEKCLPFESLKI